MRKKSTSYFPDCVSRHNAVAVKAVDLRELPQALRDQIEGNRDESGLPSALYFFSFNPKNGKPDGAPAKYVLLEYEAFLRLTGDDEPDVNPLVD
jgi:hypothetical protein